MSGILSEDSQLIYDELEKAKETVTRLRCINGFTPGFCANSAPHGPRMPPTVSRGDLARIHEQVNSLEKSIRDPVLSYIRNIEQQNLDLAEAVESIQQMLLKQQPDFRAGKMTNFCDRAADVREPSRSYRGLSNDYPKLPEGFQNSSKVFGKPSEKDRTSSGLGDLSASYKSEQESRFRADNLEKELAICRERLERSEAKVKELFKSMAQRQINNSSSSSEMFLQSQLQRQQQLAESYFKNSTSKERELSFLTIEKYNLQSEVTSLVSDLESCTRKRRELSRERKKLQASLVASHQQISDLQNEISSLKSENRQLKDRFRDEIAKERSTSEQKTRELFANDKEIKELSKKLEESEKGSASRKDAIHRLEKENIELLSKAKRLSNELKVKESECKVLKEQNEILTKNIHKVQNETILNKKDNEKATRFLQSLKSELKESQNSMEILKKSVVESKVYQSRTSNDIEAYIKEQLELKSHIENQEKEKIVLTQQLAEFQQQETEYANEIARIKASFGMSEKDVKSLTQNCSDLQTELEETRAKYLELKKANNELVLINTGLEKTEFALKDQINEITGNNQDLSERNGRLSSELKAYKRLVGERDEQLKKLEVHLNNLHEKEDQVLKDLLRKDKEIAFLKARVSTVECNRLAGGLSAARSHSQSSLSMLQQDSGQRNKETEIYLNRIVELENECNSLRSQIKKYQEQECDAEKEVQRSESMNIELAQYDEEIQKLKLELSGSKQLIKDLKVKEGQLGTVEGERDKLRQEVGKLQLEIQETAHLKQVWEQKDQEIKALRRMSSDEADLEGKVSRFKDRCREKDEEIEELHKKVLALQGKIKDFVQQNSHAEDQLRSLKERYSMEIREKEKLVHTLSDSETRCCSLEENVRRLESSRADLEGRGLELKEEMESLEMEKEEGQVKLKEMNVEMKKNREEVAALRKQVQELEEQNRKAPKQNEELLTADDFPDGASTPLENLLDGSRTSLNRSGRVSALERLDTLEEENIQLLNRIAELEEELDAAEQHGEELKNALKTKRENVSELHAELDTVKERLKSSEKRKAELTDENELLQQSSLLAKQKIEDVKVANERHLANADELEKALITAEQRVEELERRLEEVSRKRANSEGQLQSMFERLSRKEKELEAVENQMEEQRKLCDGFKASAEKQEALIEKLRAEKISAEEALLAMKLELAKKDVAYKARKEKVSEMQSRVYETEDKFSSKTVELKKVNRENERLKREINNLEAKVIELQSILKKSTSLQLERTSPTTGVYNMTFQKITTSVKGNSQSMEGLDSKLNEAQSKISSLEVELANDLRKFSLRRMSSDVPRRSFSPTESRLSPSTHTMRSPRSQSNFSPDDRESPKYDYSPSINENVSKSRSTPEISIPHRDSMTPDHALITSKGDASLRFGDGMKSCSTPEISIPHGDILVNDYTSRTSVGDISASLGDVKEFEESGKISRNTAENELSELDPFLSNCSSTELFSSSGQNTGGYLKRDPNPEFVEEALSFFVDAVPLESSQAPEVQEVQEVVTSSAAVFTGSVTSLPSPSIHLGLEGEETMIYF